MRAYPSEAKKRRPILILLVIYLIVLLRLVIFKDALSLFNGQMIDLFSHERLQEGMRQVNFIPLRTICYYLRGEEPLQPTIENLAGNIVLFLPFGLLLPALFPMGLRFGRVMRVICLTSLSIELIQLLLTKGACDIDDILLNSLGGCLGFLLYRIGFWFFSPPDEEEEEMPAEEEVF